MGTLAYISPEQLQEAPVTERTDIYAVGLVLSRRLTGRRWPPLMDPGKGDWSRVPRHLRAPIRRAVQFEPDDRWQDVASFAAALESAERRWRMRWTAVGAVGLAAAGLIAVESLPPRRWEGSPPLRDLAVFPFTSVGLADSSTGPRVAGLADWSLARAQQITTAPRHTVYSTWYDSPLPPAQRLTALTGPATGSRYGLGGNVTPKGDLLEVRFTVIGEGGKPAFEGTVTGSAADPAVLADSLAALITRQVFSQPDKHVRNGGPAVPHQAGGAGRVSARRGCARP